MIKDFCQMSKKKDNKKAVEKPVEPEPTPIVEVEPEPEGPSPEEIEKERKYLANIDRVKFRAPLAKNIVSPHSGSILSAPEPVTTLDPVLKDNACVAYRAFAVDQVTVPSASIVDILVKCGFLCDIEQLAIAVKAIYSGPAEIDEYAFLDFLQRFHAPEYYYGQRMRRNAGRGQISEVVQLLVRGCDVNTGDGEGLSALHYASEFNKCGVIRAMVATVPPGKLIVDCQDRYGWSPLYCAAHHGNLDVVVLLLELGANPLLRNKVGKTAFHAACAQNRAAIVDVLLKSCASSKSESASSPLTVADDKGMTPLHEAAYRGHGSLYQVLSRNPGADLSIRDLLKYTAADYLGDLSVVRPVSPRALPTDGEITSQSSTVNNRPSHK